MLLVGLTGGIGAGKSSVAARFEQHGAIIIDADVAARHVVEPGTLGLEAIKARFGSEYLLPDGTLDRRALGQLVFSDDDARADLNGIVHPLVRAHINDEAASYAHTDHIVILMIPLLVESGRYKTDVTIVVDCDENIAIQRLMATRGLSEKESRARIDAQASRHDRRAIADLVIDNSGDQASLARQVDAAWQWLGERNGEAAVNPLRD